MARRIGNYQFLINPTHSNRVVRTDEREVKMTLESIDKLAFILEEAEWVLTGGLAIPTTIGQFYRKHRDLDIGVDLNDLPEIKKKAEENGYGLFSRVFMTKVSSGRKLDIYRGTTLDEVRSGRFNRLRFVRLNQTGEIVNHNALLDYFNVFLHMNHDGSLVSFEEGFVFPKNHNFGVIYTTLSGRQIKVRHMEYIREIKSNLRGEIDKVDLKVIESYRTQSL